MNARKSTVYLYFLGKLNPKAWDAIIPHGPKISRAGREYLIAQSIKGFAAELNNRSLAKRLDHIQKRLVDSSAQSLVADYDGDDWCPPRKRIPIPFPEPGPFPWISFADVPLNPQPLPPGPELQREVGGYLLMLSEVTSLDDVAMDLQAIANGLLGVRSTPRSASNLPLPASRGRNVRPLVPTGI